MASNVGVTSTTLLCMILGCLFSYRVTGHRPFDHLHRNAWELFPAPPAQESGGPTGVAESQERENTTHDGLFWPMRSSPAGPNPHHH